MICDKSAGSSLDVFILEDALSVQKGNVSSPFLYERRIIRLDQLGQTFIDRLIMSLKYEDEHKTHYASRRIILLSAS